MAFLETRIPPPLVGLLVAILTWLLSGFGFGFIVPQYLKIIVVTVLVVIGFGIPVTASVSFRKARTTINPLNPEQATSLVKTGVFAITRNPMYLGMAILLLAWGFYLATVTSLLGCIIFIFYIDRFQIQPEERALVAIFADEFDDYKSNVRRWL